ncbi:MAG TPA: class II aldolase/adducin family protein [Negativicutes bacterium]|jgi:ribulose-5-phosphate 4-epimerase/fuculose-1-phosphate aldolase
MGALRPESAKEAIDLCVLANRILANEGVFDAFGHVSVRNPENSQTFFQSCSVSPEFVTHDDILEIDIKGNVVTKTDKKPYGERVIHSAIFKARLDVNAVYHGHPFEVIPFSSTGIAIKPVIYPGSMFYEGVPLYDAYDVSSGMLIVSCEEGDRLARVLGDKRGLILRDHGAVVVGENVPLMVNGAVFLRDNAKVQYQTLQLGEPKYISHQEGYEAFRKLTNELTVNRTWDYWVRRVEKSGMAI